MSLGSIRDPTESKSRLVEFSPPADGHVVVRVYEERRNPAILAAYFFFTLATVVAAGVAVWIDPSYGALILAVASIGLALAKDRLAPYTKGALVAEESPEREPVSDLFPAAAQVEGSSVEEKLRQAVDEEARRAFNEDTDAESGPTPAALEAAQTVEQLARQSRRPAVREQVRDLAGEYESIRKLMPPGDARTRRMEVVFAKMRALAFASKPLLDDLKQSDSPGERLAAVAILQMTPDPTSLDWLADRVKAEKPFIGYHAAVALLNAARELANGHRGKVKAAIEAALAYLGPGKDETDRKRTLDEALRVVSAPPEND